MHVHLPRLTPHFSATKLSSGLENLGLGRSAELIQIVAISCEKHSNHEIGVSKVVRQIVADIQVMVQLQKPYSEAVSGQKRLRRSQGSKGEEAIPSDNAMIHPAKRTTNLFTAILTRCRGGRFLDRKNS